jgi:hypothetical protein
MSPRVRGSSWSTTSLNDVSAACPASSAHTSWCSAARRLMVALRSARTAPRALAASAACASCSAASSCARLWASGAWQAAECSSAMRSGRRIRGARAVHGCTSIHGCADSHAASGPAAMHPICCSADLGPCSLAAPAPAPVASACVPAVVCPHSWPKVSAGIRVSSRSACRESGAECGRSVEAGALPPFRSRTPRRTDTGAVRAVVSHSGTPPSDARACGGTTRRNDSLPCSPAAASASCSSAMRASGATPSRQRTCPRPRSGQPFCKAVGLFCRVRSRRRSPPVQRCAARSSARGARRHGLGMCRFAGVGGDPAGHHRLAEECVPQAALAHHLLHLRAAICSSSGLSRSRSRLRLREVTHVAASLAAPPTLTCQCMLRSREARARCSSSSAARVF